MNDYNVNAIEEKENVLAGIVGAFLFSLVGGVLWFLLYQIGYLAAISGIVGVICAVKGYTFFTKTKRESVKCLVISVIIAILVLAIAWYLCVANDIRIAYEEWYLAGEVDFTVTFFEAVGLVPLFFTEPEILSAYLGDLFMGILCAGIGVASYLISRKKRKDAEAAAAEAAKRAQEAQETENDPFENNLQ